ncbi:DJ-1 family protein, partial [Salmonella enterica subsp. enterica serovar Enteritidis]
HQDQVLVVDGKLVTSRGPATALEFAYQLVEQLGGDSSDLRERMQYNKLTEYLQK